MVYFNKIKTRSMERLKEIKKLVGKYYNTLVLYNYYLMKFSEARRRPNRRIIHVNPQNIKYYLLTSDLTRDFRDFDKSYAPKHNLEKGTFSPHGFRDVVLPGDWDIYKKPYSLDNVYDGMKKYIIEDKNVNETSYYHSYLIKEKIKEEKNYAEGILEEKKELCDQIIKNGYRSQYEVGKKRYSDEPYKRPSEICINIGRNGELIFNNSDAHHRLAFAKLLGINKVPVVVIVRHAKWEEIRRNVINSNKYSRMDNKTRQHITHPDIEYLLD